MSTEQNIDIVRRALAGLAETGDAEALGAFLGDDFVHHRPDGTTRTKAEWLAAVRAARGPLAEMRIDVVHLLADRDHVVVHSRRHLPGGGSGVTVVDIIRLTAGRITEVWETIELNARAAANLTWWEPDPV